MEMFPKDGGVASFVKGEEKKAAPTSESRQPASVGNFDRFPIDSLMYSLWFLIHSCDDTKARRLCAFVICEAG